MLKLTNSKKSHYTHKDFCERLAKISKSSKNKLIEDNTQNKLYWASVEIHSSHGEDMNSSDFETARRVIDSAVSDSNVRKVKTWFKDFYYGSANEVSQFVSACSELDNYFWIIKGPEELTDTLAKQLNLTINEALEGIEVGETISSATDIGIASMISDLIQREWEAIDQYQSALVTASDVLTNASTENIKSDEISSVLQDIVREKNVHIGQLEALLQKVTPQAQFIDVGKAEGEQQIDNVTTPIISQL